MVIPKIYFARGNAGLRFRAARDEAFRLMRLAFHPGAQFEESWHRLPRRVTATHRVTGRVLRWESATKAAECFGCRPDTILALCNTHGKLSAAGKPYGLPYWAFRFDAEPVTPKNACTDPASVRICSMIGAGFRLSDAKRRKLLKMLKEWEREHVEHTPHQNPTFYPLRLVA